MGSRRANSDTLGMAVSFKSRIPTPQAMTSRKFPVNPKRFDFRPRVSEKIHQQTLGGFAGGGTRRPREIRGAENEEQ
eukprot:2230588-Rhodomonas_salina.1